MELKQGYNVLNSAETLLLIVPYGIETHLRK